MYPSSGVAFGWTVLGFGFLALAGSLAAVAVAVAFRAASQHGAGPATLAVARAQERGAWPPLQDCPRLLSPEFISRSTPERPYRGTGPFGHLRDGDCRGDGGGHPDLRQQPVHAGLASIAVWMELDLRLVCPPGTRRYPAAPGRQPPARRSYVAAWTRISFATAELDGQAVPVLFATPHAALTPPILSGHQVSGRDQIVLAPATLAQIHQHLGGTVMFRLNGPAVSIHTRLTIVGTATMPTVGLAQGLHTSMGTARSLTSSSDRWPPALPRPAWPSSGCATG